MLCHVVEAFFMYSMSTSETWRKGVNDTLYKHSTLVYDDAYRKTEMGLTLSNRYSKHIGQFDSILPSTQLWLFRKLQWKHGNVLVRLPTNHPSLLYKTSLKPLDHPTFLRYSSHFACSGRSSRGLLLDRSHSHHSGKFPCSDHHHRTCKRTPLCKHMLLIRQLTHPIGHCKVGPSTTQQEARYYIF